MMYDIYFVRYHDHFNWYCQVLVLNRLDIKGAAHPSHHPMSAFRSLDPLDLLDLCAKKDQAFSSCIFPYIHENLEQNTVCIVFSLLHGRPRDQNIRISKKYSLILRILGRANWPLIFDLFFL